MGSSSRQGILCAAVILYIVDALAKEARRIRYGEGRAPRYRSTLPVGAPPGVVPKFLRRHRHLSGADGTVLGIAAAADGTIYVSADPEGSVLALRPA